MRNVLVHIWLNASRRSTVTTRRARLLFPSLIIKYEFKDTYNASTVYLSAGLFHLFGCVGEIMSDYHYFPLSSQSHIRLLRLLPKAEGDHDELCGELVEYDLMLYDDGAHPYEALSYCWESEDKPCVLMIHGKALAMTRSLYTALVRLRHFAFERVLWIDAVCIDQPNDREKESQIPLMGEIFAKAQSVLVWLGEECDSSSLALGAIVSAAKNAQQENVGNLKNLNATTIESIQRLLKRPWFSRIWVSD